jgi:trehalose-phosphatase
VGLEVSVTAASTGDLPSALASLDAIRERLAGKRLAVFLDYDGTLTPIVQRPEGALLSERMRGILTRLAARCPVAIVSGRDLRDLRALVGIDALYYAGSHGLEAAGPHGWHAEHKGGAAFLPALDAAEGELAAQLPAVPAARLERKRFAIAVHYRQVPDEEAGRVEGIVERVRAAHPRLRKTGGKKVFELRPDLDWDKGKALFWLLQALGLPREGTLLLYIGDDVTDEDAFQELAATGIGIVVTDGERRPTSAQLALRDPAEVERFLGGLLS